MHPKSFVGWAPPEPGGAAYSYSDLPHPLAGFQGPTSRGEGWEGDRREQGRGGVRKGKGLDLPDQSYVPGIARNGSNYPFIHNTIFICVARH